MLRPTEFISAKSFAVNMMNQPIPKIKKAGYLQQMKVDTSIILSERERVDC